jgi:steroid delta-isomerase-like uncharacterized protein
MMAEQSVRMVQQFVDYFNKDDTAGMLSLLSADFVDRTPNPNQSSGSDGFLHEKLVELRRSFPDARLTIEDVIPAAGKIAWRWALAGTNLGAFAGREPTGRAVSFQGINIERVADERIVEHWSIHDSMALLNQLGFFDQAQAYERPDAAPEGG